MSVFGPKLLALLLLPRVLQSMLRSLTLGSTALAASQAGSNVPREACLFASIAPDGKVRRRLSRPSACLDSRGNGSCGHSTPLDGWPGTTEPTTTHALAEPTAY